jgi:hypothetical protein
MVAACWRRRIATREGETVADPLWNGTGQSEVLGMTSSASSASWLPAAIARAAVVHPAPADRPGGRHLAPDVPGMVRIAAPEDLSRSGRHTESEWSRDLHDPRRDPMDAFEWLGFGPN